MIYDIFYVSSGKILDQQFEKIRSRFPTIQKIENAKNFDSIKSKSLTKFFWIIWDNIDVDEKFNFSYRVDKWDQEYIHVFKNNCNGVESFFNGICLAPKFLTVTEKEFKHRFFLHKKEIDIVASKSQYPKIKIDSYDQYLGILENSSCDMFWSVPADIDILDESVFNLYYDSRDGKHDYDRNENHVFKNGQYYDGITLFSRNKLISEREFKNRFFVSKKEHNIVVSKPLQFEAYNINTYEEYLNVLNTCKTNMFWVVWLDIELIKNLAYQVPYYDQHIIHVFKNNEFYDGVVLFPKNEKVSKKEFDFRFYKNRKEIDIQMSIPKPFDIIFISYDEPNADENFLLLQNRFPRAKRIHGIKGIHQAHIEAAKISDTEMFWVVDGDAQISEDFNFDVEYFPHYDVGNRENFLKTVKIYHSKNPVNDLEYGYGGVKLLPRDLTLSMRTDTTDMTTSISKSIKMVSKVSNYTVFNTDPFNAWKSAFRECAKLSSKIIDRSYDDETDARLEIWCTKGADKPFGEYCIKGALAGKKYGYRYIGNSLRLSLINDFNWLKERFEEDCG